MLQDKSGFECGNPSVRVAETPADRTQGRVSRLNTNTQWKNEEVCPILGHWGVPLLSHDTYR